MKKRIVFCALFVFLSISFAFFLDSALLQKPKSAVLSEDFTSKLNIGDWVFRSGSGTDSRLVKHISGGIYSHIGVIVSLKPEIKIIHATTDDFPEKQNQVLETSLSDFLQPDLAEKYAVARPLFLNDKQKKSIAEYLIAQKSRAFVLSPRHEDHLYCTSLIADAIRREYKDFSPKWKKVDIAIFEGEYLFPKAFSDYPNIKWVWVSDNP